jgi:hypothetical protein
MSRYPEFEYLLSQREKPLEDLIEDGNAHIPDHLHKTYKEKTCQVIDRITEIGLPKEREQLRLITMRSFNSIALIQHVAENEVIEKAILVIFAINIPAAQLLINLFNESKIQTLELVVSSVRNAGYKIKSNAVKMLADVKGISLCFVNSHAKISAIKTVKGNYYVVEGSGNFSYNGRIEQYIIDNDKSIYDFTENWVDDMKKTMKDKKEFLIINK